ncbi:leukocyte surface antigen CD53-like [Oppia nitens]|uniref:leukocyte surface antigen CD53-like n=1 Tax=Oppia nitens TaxID=1686743 RepID=UPI0023DA07B5|nr:leukocyte surface antigen CD53-like [Oppia nitens]
MGCIAGLVKHLVCLLAFLTWLTGSIIIAYTLWALGTSSNMKRLFTGTLPLTYVGLGLGSLLFINGLLGWMGSYKRGGCMLKMFLFFCVLTIAAEIGGIISLSILKTKVSDIVEQGWDEVNQRTRNLVQEQLQCCGITGLAEFANNTDPIDESCYHIEYKINGTSVDPKIPERVPNRIGCKPQLVDWIFKHKMYWISSFAGFLLFQVFTVLLTVSAINHLKVRSSSMESLDEHQTITYM